MSIRIIYRAEIGRSDRRPYIFRGARATLAGIRTVHARNYVKALAGGGYHLRPRLK